MYEINGMLGAGQETWGPLTAYLLTRGLTIQAIRLFNPRLFMIQGKSHLRTSAGAVPWTTEQDQIFNNTWTDERVMVWKALISQWLTVYDAASDRISNVMEQPDFIDVIW